MSSWNKSRKVHLKDTMQMYGIRCNRKPNWRKHELQSSENLSDVTCGSCLVLQLPVSVEDGAV